MNWISTEALPGQKKMRAGLCVRCGNPRDDKRLYTLCRGCAEKSRVAAKRGLCACGTPCRRSICRTCYDKLSPEEKRSRRN